MEKITFTNSYQQLFNKAGLNCLDDFFNYNTGTRVNKNNKREVIKFTLETKNFFMKRFYNPHFKDILSAKLTFGKFYCQARVEWENANLLLKNEIGTYRPVCFGQITKLGLESRSFFVTEQLSGQCFTDFVKENWGKIEPLQKQNILSGIAKTIRKVHNAGISLADLYLWHIYLNKTDDSYTFDIIDLHRMSHNVTNKNKQIENLGRFDHSMTDKYFDENDRRFFVEAYADNNWPEDIEKLMTKVKKYSKKVSAKRNPKPY